MHLHCTLGVNLCIVFKNRTDEITGNKFSGYWTNASTERQFGSASENGNFSGNGSPRWKQRTFYDFCRDLYSIVFEIPVYRLSIYDEIDFRGGKITLGTTL